MSLNFVRNLLRLQMKNNLFPWNTDMGLFPIVLVDTVQAVVYLLNLWLNLLTIFECM